jgi:hypothetical protein
VLGAAVIARGARALASADRGFEALEQLAIVSPADPGFAERLRSAARA